MFSARLDKDTELCRDACHMVGIAMLLARDAEPLFDEERRNSFYSDQQRTQLDPGPIAQHQDANRETYDDEVDTACAVLRGSSENGGTTASEVGSSNCIASSNKASAAEASAVSTALVATTKSTTASARAVVARRRGVAKRTSRVAQ